MEPDIVISGIGSCISQACNVNEFKEFMLNNVNTLGQARWAEGELNVCGKIHKMTTDDLFDATFFGMHRQQASVTCSNQKLILERSFEALMDAGVNPSEISGRNVGVFISNETTEENSCLFEKESGFTLIGQVNSLIANRVSYFFNINGPSYSCYSTWNGGLQTLQQATDAIRSGQCESALVGACSLALTSSLSYAFDKLSLLSPDGLTNAFGAEANGYGRGEAIVVLYIQRADLAKRHYATILYTDLRFNGNRNGKLYDKSATSFTDFLRECYAKSGINPHDIEYLEAYGCGIKAIDELEMNAIDEVLCKNRKTPLCVGAIKPSIGHTESCADLVNIVKVLIAMETGIIPATLNYKTPNPNIAALTSGRVQIVTKNKEWNSGIAAINSIGLASAYGHVILKANPIKRIAKTIAIPLLTVFSARTEEGINKNIEVMKTQSDFEYTSLVHNLYKYNIAGHLYRGYTINGKEFKSATELCSGDKKPFWFIYSGMGSQWHTMGRDLMVLPVFAAAIHKCHAILVPKNMDLLKIITDDDPTIFDEILNSFVGISAIQIALTDLLRSIDIVPAGIIGHSVGELGCAYADECLTAEEVIMGAYYRGVASAEADLQVGMMAAIGLGAQKIKSLCPPEIDIACHNSSNSCTISGPTKEMEIFVNRLQQTGIFGKLVNVSNIAYHSRYIQPAGPLLLKYLKNLITNPKLRTDKWISTSVPESEWESDLAKSGSAEYFTNNLLSPVLFEEHSKYIPDNAIAIEIAPHGILQAILTRSLEGVVNVPLTKRNTNGVDFLLNAFGKLYLSGGNFKISALYPSISYPVSRGVRSTSDLVQWHHEEHWPVLGVTKVRSHYVQIYPICSNDEQYSYTLDMQIDKKYTLPPSLYLGLVYKLLKTSKVVDNITFENVQFHKYISYSRSDTVAVHIEMHEGSGKFQITANNELLVTGYTNSMENTLEINSQHESTPTINTIHINEFYKEFANRGHNYVDSFKSIKKICITEKGVNSVVEWKNDWKLIFEAMLQIYCYTSGEIEQNMLMPSFIRYLSISLNKLPQKATDLDVNFCTSNNMISTPGVSLCYVQFRPITLEIKNIKVDYVKKIENTNVQTKTQCIVTNNYKIIKITPKTFCFDDLIKKSNPWAIELSTILANENLTSKQRIFIVARTLPTEGIDKFINKLQVYSKNEPLRFIFHIDTEPSKLIDNDFYRHIFEKDVLLSIFQNGKWEYHVTVNDIYVKNCDKIVDSVLLSTLTSDFSNTCKVTYVGVNSKELTQPSKPDQFEIGHLDYAGIAPSNKKIMGLARTDLITCEAEPDPQFSWPVPENWTLSDAATVPYAYLAAYYILMEKSDLKMGQSVLIHAGYTAFGNAVIRILIAHNCVIYTSVACEEQRQQLTTLFPQLPDDHIMDSNTTEFEWKLLAKRNGVGIDLVINCLSGELMNASKQCVDAFGKFIQLGVSKDDEHDGTGSKVFLKNVKLYGVSLWRIVELDEEIKMRLHGYIADGIRQNIVIPITKTIFNMDEIDYLTSYLQSIEQNGAAILKMMNESSLSKKTLYRCDKNGIYIIYGGNPDSWINLVEWLTKRGAKTLLIVTKSQQNPYYINRRLTLINRAYNTNIIVTMEKAQTITDLLTGAAKLGLIKDIFVLGADFEAVNKTCNNINSVTKNQKIVCLLENCTGAFYVSDNIITIKWESKHTFMDVLNILDGILQSSGLDFVLRNDTTLLQDKQEENDLITFYPRYLDDIKRIGRNMPKTTTITQLQSACSMVRNDVPPVFLIPGASGFNCSHIKHFIKKIMSPVFGIQLSTNDLNTNYASTISQILLKNYSTNFYNIIGVSFGGLIALEIAQCLETYGVQVQLTLLDGTPGVIKEYTKCFNKKDDFKKKLLSQLNISNDDSVELDQGVSMLKAYTEYSNLYQTKNKLFSGDTYLFQPDISESDGFGIAQYCKKAVSKMTGGDHRTMLEDKKLINFVNEHIEFLD